MLSRKPDVDIIDFARQQSKKYYLFNECMRLFDFWCEREIFLEYYFAYVLGKNEKAPQFLIGLTLAVKNPIWD